MRQRLISIAEVEEPFMMKSILGNQKLNAGRPEVGVKGGGDSQDQIREPKYQIIGSVLDIRYSFVDSRGSDLGTLHSNFGSRNLAFGVR